MTLNQLHEVQSLFLHFYLASCHELIAQPMQSLSPAKLANLYDAKHHFELALTILDHVRSHKRSSSASHGATSDFTSSSEPASSPQTPASPPKGRSDQKFSKDQPTHLITTALSARKQENKEPTLDDNDHKENKDQLVDISPAQWLAGSPTSTPKDDPFTTPKRQNTKSKTPSPTVRLGHPVFVSAMRCNRLAGELIELVTGNIAWIEIAIDNGVQAHQRRIDISSLDEEVDKEEKAKQKKEFIRTRKAEGWKRNRFDARRTQALCKVALEEL